MRIQKQERYRCFAPGPRLRSRQSVRLRRAYPSVLGVRWSGEGTGLWDQIGNERFDLQGCVRCFGVPRSTQGRLFDCAQHYLFEHNGKTVDCCPRISNSFFARLFSASLSSRFRWLFFETLTLCSVLRWFASHRSEPRTVLKMIGVFFSLVSPTCRRMLLSTNQCSNSRKG